MLPNTWIDTLGLILRYLNSNQNYICFSPVFIVPEKNGYRLFSEINKNTLLVVYDNIYLTIVRDTNRNHSCPDRNQYCNPLQVITYTEILLITVQGTRSIN